MEKEEPKVLIVDDDNNILEMLSTFFAMKGIKSYTCASPDDALTYLRSADNIKLVLLDINMPEITGVELLEKFIDVVPSTHVIMITGHEDLEQAMKCMDYGAKDYINKPFDFEYLETSAFAEIIPQL